MKKLFYIFIVVFLSLSFINSFSQTKSKFATKNVWEVGGSVGFSSITPVSNGNTGNSTTIISFRPYGGYFVSDGFEIGLIPAIDYMTYGSNSSTSFAVYLAPAYNFQTRSSIYPYFQGAIGFNSVSGDGITSVSGIAWGIEGGAKINITGNCLLKFAIDYNQRTLNSSNSSGGRNGYNSFNFFAGFNVFFY